MTSSPSWGPVHDPAGPGPLRRGAPGTPSTRAGRDRAAHRGDPCTERRVRPPGGRSAGRPPGCASARPRSSAPTTWWRSASCRSSPGAGSPYPMTAPSSDTTTSTSRQVPPSRCRPSASLARSSAGPPRSCSSRRRRTRRGTSTGRSCSSRSSSSDGPATSIAGRAASRPSRRETEGMRVALFATCLVDTLYPDVGQGDRSAAAPARGGGRVSRASRRVAVRCTSTPATSGRRCRWSATTSRRFEPYDAVVAPSGSCVGAVRHQHAMVARRAGEESLAQARRSGRRQDVRAVGAAGRRAEGRGRGGGVPAPGHLPSDLPLACGCCGSTTSRCGCCAKCATSTSSSSVTPTSAAVSVARSRSRTPTSRRPC